MAGYVKYNLSEDEISSGHKLGALTECVITNLICDCVEARLALEYDHVNPLRFVQREAELKGQMGILQYLLELSQS